MGWAVRAVAEAAKVVEIRLEHIQPWPLPRAGAGSEVWNQELCFAPGTFVLVKAPSGKGKTTLLSLLYGLRRDYEGQVQFDGMDTRPFGRTTWSQVRTRRLAVVFQDLQLFPDLTARQNVEIKNHLTGHRTCAQIEAMFVALGIADRLDVLTGALSVGQKQRVAIIRALCQPCEYLLLDEPFSHLDPDNTRKAAGLILEECRQQKAGAILTSLAGEVPWDCQAVFAL